MNEKFGRDKKINLTSFYTNSKFSSFEFNFSLAHISYSLGRNSKFLLLEFFRFSVTKDPDHIRW